jgi:hypothetical protein
MFTPVTIEVMPDAYCLFNAVVALEEQKVSVARELSSLKNTHNKVSFCWTFRMFGLQACQLAR